MFVMRFRAPDGYKIPPHWHTQDEHLTVLAGQFALHVGDTMKGEPHVLAQGGYHYLPGGLHHAAEARGETIVEITGHGPFDIHYVNPADNPVQQSARR
jgi:quercetin dioxygenase-like cupin family protein